MRTSLGRCDNKQTIFWLEIPCSDALRSRLVRVYISYAMRFLLTPKILKSVGG